MLTLVVTVVLLPALAISCAAAEQVVSAAPGATINPSVLLRDAKAAQDWIIGLRRELHAIPELGSAEYKTSAAIKRALDSLGVTYKDGYFGTGIVAIIGTSKPPAVALRADMDALPIQEEPLPSAPLPFASTHPGRMHACGHDGHTAMLLGAARLLKGREADLPGTVRLVFQPNEEFGAGGDHMVREGALDGGVAAAFAMHVAPWIPSGALGVRAGTIMAGALSFHVTISGRGGHAAMPHLNVDPVVAAAATISAAQTLVSRETSPLGSAVLSVTLQRAGHAYNVIPDVAEFGGTIRALSHADITRLQGRLEVLVAGTAAAHGCNATVDWRLDEQPYYPPTVNDAQVARGVADVAAHLLGPSSVDPDTQPIMAGEDFGFFCRAVPCTLAFLGIRNDSAGSVHALHSPRFTLDESVLAHGAALHAAWAVGYLAQLADSGSQTGQGKGHTEL